jgi:hypothetical protein
MPTTARPLRWAARWIAAALASLTAFAPAKAGPLQDLFARAGKAPGAAVDHSEWDRLLKRFVRPGPDGINRVDYQTLRREQRPALDAYIARLEATDVGRLDRAGQFALFANLYNAKTVAIVLERYPVASIRDIRLGGGLTATFIGGPWQAKVLRLGGIELSLDDIEHGIMRPLFKDPRVHYAVNCASTAARICQPRRSTAGASRLSSTPPRAPTSTTRAGSRCATGGFRCPRSTIGTRRTSAATIAPLLRMGCAMPRPRSQTRCGRFRASIATITTGGSTTRSADRACAAIMRAGYRIAKSSA